jgi:hypothetical protein
MKNRLTIEVLFMIFATSFLLGCATQNRCERKFPAQTETITVVRDSLITIEKKIFETRDILKRDTVTIVDTVTNIKIKYLRLPGDSIWIKADCPEEQIKVKTSTTTTNVKRGSEKKGGVPGFLKFSIVVLSLSILLFVIYRILKLFKPSLFGVNDN